MKYSIIIPTYNHCDDLLKPCVESLLKYSKVSDIQLVISANGCTDNTFEYLGSLKYKFISLGLSENLKIIWNEHSLGYSQAVNLGIKSATCDYIVLLHNDVILLPQQKNHWLNLLEQQFAANENCGISCVQKLFNETTQSEVADSFTVMIHKKVFEKIHLFNTDYVVGGGENIEFCFKAKQAGFKICQSQNLSLIHI